MKQLLDKYKTLRTQREYLKIILANLINRFGDSIDAIAFTWLVYQITHDPAWSAIIFGVNIIPTIILQPLAGGFVERIKKQKVMVCSDIGRGIGVSIIAIFYLMDILNPWILLVITIINSSLEALRVPAGIAIVPKLLDKECYDVGVSLNSSMSQVMQLVGTGCAGIIISMMGIASAIFIDAITFFLSALVISWIKYKEEIVQVAFTIKNYLNTMKEGIQYVKKRDTIVLLCVMGALINMCGVPVNSLLPAFIDQVMKGDSSTYSLLIVCMTLGMMSGAFLYPSFAKHISGKIAFVGGMAFSGIFYVILVGIPSIVSEGVLLISIMVGLFFLFGIVNAIVSTWVSVFFITYIDEEYMARCGAVFNASVCAIMPIVSFLITVGLQFMGMSQLIFISGVITILIGIVLFFNKKVKNMEEVQQKEEEVL